MKFFLMIMITLMSTAFGKTNIVDSKELGGNNRFITAVSIDKPIYKTGETIFIRSILLGAGTYFPIKENHPVTIKILDAQEGIKATLQSNIENSTSGVTWNIPDEIAGGRYKVSVEVAELIVTRDFEIRAYTPPRLSSQIEFFKEGYGPGETVNAAINIKRAEGSIPTGAKVTAIARVDNIEVARIEGLVLNGEGNVSATFTLPAEIEIGEGSLAFIIEDGGVVETATKTIPIILQNMEIHFYPEGGEIVAGMQNRVYMEAFRPDGKPADLTGEVIQLGNNSVVAEVKTLHEGRGYFEFTPIKAQAYAMKIVEPLGISKEFQLPKVLDKGVMIRSQKETYPYSEKIAVTVESSKDTGISYITLYKREKLISKEKLKEGENRLQLNPKDSEGVLMVTVWDKSNKPLAERLIFREPKYKLNINLEVITKTNAPSPGDEVEIKVTTTDDHGKPVEAVVGIVVTDDSVLEMVENRDKAPTTPVMFYLENEVLELADATVYFDTNNLNASRDIDLLLGTQGWRRFVLVDMENIAKINKEATKRIMAKNIIHPVPSLYARGNIIYKASPVFDDFMPEIVMAAAPPPVPMEEMRIVEAEDIIDLDAKDIAIGQDFDKVAIGRMDNRFREVLPRVTREYAFKKRSNRQPNDRVDFTETLYWNAGISTNPRDGMATVKFDLSDSITTFKVSADGFGNNGALGETSTDINSVEPFYIEPKLPNTALIGDTITLPVVAVNSTNETLNSPNIIINTTTLKTAQVKIPAHLTPNSRIRAIYAVEANNIGDHEITLKGAAGGYLDTVTRKVKIVPRGFPVNLTASGLLGPEHPYEGSFTIADDVMQGSMVAEIQVYPSPLANLEDALTALLRKPYGCFEQTSSTSYPLVMAQQYFISHPNVSPAKIVEADKLLQESYGKLISFESPEKGYEWFGGNPGHEALTAYGLMQFLEMKKVMDVDDGMIDRTKNWLMDRRDGKGGYKRNEKALDSFGAAPAPLTNLYITWTLLESGEKPSTLKNEIEAAKKIVETMEDPYILALGANIMVLANESALAKNLANRLVKLIDKEGSISGAETSITRSGGQALKIETTAFTIIAWLRLGNDYAGPIETSIKWLFEQSTSGAFGSTQSTILALKAITMYDKYRSTPKKPGEILLYIDGKPYGKPLAFTKDTTGIIKMADFSAALTSGTHTITLKMKDGAEMPFSLTINYNSPQPTNAENTDLELSTSLSASNITEGELVDLNIELKALKDIHMPLSIIGLPAGLEPRHERLKELMGEGIIDYYEIIDRELILYWRVMKKGVTTKVSVPMVADKPGNYTAPASRAYPFYTDENKFWTKGESITIEAKE